MPEESPENEPRGKFVTDPTTGILSAFRPDGTLEIKSFPNGKKEYYDQEGNIVRTTNKDGFVMPNKNTKSQKEEEEKREIKEILPATNEPAPLETGEAKPGEEKEEEKQRSIEEIDRIIREELAEEASILEKLQKLKTESVEPSAEVLKKEAKEETKKDEIQIPIPVSQTEKLSSLQLELQNTGKARWLKRLKLRREIRLLEKYIEPARKRQKKEIKKTPTPVEQQKLVVEKMELALEKAKEDEERRGEEMELKSMKEPEEKRKFLERRRQVVIGNLPEVKSDVRFYVKRIESGTESQQQQASVALASINNSPLEHYKSKLKSLMDMVGEGTNEFEKREIQKKKEIVEQIIAINQRYAQLIASLGK